MASVKKAEIRETECSIQVIDPHQAVLESTPRPLKPVSSTTISILQHHPSLNAILGPSPTHSLLLSSFETSKNPFFHSALIHLPSHDELYITSDLLQSTNSSALPVILISKLSLHRSATGAVDSVEWSKLRPPAAMPMPAGGARWKDGMLFCSQGSLEADGGLFYMPRGKPPEAVVRGYFGRGFNSVCGVAVSRFGDADGEEEEEEEEVLWFTDPCYGAEKEFRPEPRMPCHVYCYRPKTGDLRVVADGVGRPYGVAVSYDGETVYVTDADAVRAATVYAFDVVGRAGAPFLANRRVFAYALNGVPMGIQCDRRGNVYVGCADGVEIWNAGGTMLGVIEVPGGLSNLAFGRKGEMFLAGEQRLWRVQLAE